MIAPAQLAAFELRRLELYEVAAQERLAEQAPPSQPKFKLRFSFSLVQRAFECLRAPRSLALRLASGNVNR